ncbi:hypothetical protein V2S84_17545, partial [Azotobacter chroococcum]|nr:hypothetical protein [Azotobacter chroococcum]
MSASQRAWDKAKAEKMIRSEIESIGKSQYPSQWFAQGMIELAYALGLLTDNDLLYWRDLARSAADNRWEQLHKG